jgi:hypothetical protein
MLIEVVVGVEVPGVPVLFTMVEEIYVPVIEVELEGFVVGQETGVLSLGAERVGIVVALGTALDGADPDAEFRLTTSDSFM